MLEHPAAAKFRAHIMDGEWERVSVVLHLDHITL